MEPEFFGNMIMVNGNTGRSRPWNSALSRPLPERLRLRFLILDFSQILAWKSGRSAMRAVSSLRGEHHRTGQPTSPRLAERADMIVTSPMCR